MSLSTVPTDIFFAEFDGRRFAWGLSAANVRETAESSFWFGSSADLYALGDIWVETDAESGWRIVRRNMPVVQICVEYNGEVGGTNHVSWQCPECASWSSEDVEHDEAGPLLVRCDGRHDENGEIWVALNW